MPSYDHRQGRFIQFTKRWIIRSVGYWKRTHWLVRLVGCLYFVFCVTKSLVEIFSGPRFAKNDHIDLYANRIGTHALPSISHPYDTLPFCDARERPRVSFREALAGDRPVHLSSYNNITFATHLPMPQMACQMSLTTTDLKVLRRAVRSNAFLEYHITDLPLRMYIGTVGEKGWFDFPEGGMISGASTRSICHAPSSRTTTPTTTSEERLYLLPHAHFILGYFAEDRLTSARLVTDFSRKVDITDDRETLLHVNFTYSVEWRREAFLDWPHRHSRYFRIFLFVSERLRNQHLSVGAAWSSFVLYVMIVSWLCFLYTQGDHNPTCSSPEHDTVRTDGGVDWMPSLGHQWLDSAFLLGMQINVIVASQFFLNWQSLVSPMVRGSILQSLLLTFLFTCPTVGYIAERRSIGWWRVMCLATLPVLVMWLTAQHILPDNCTGKLTKSWMIHLLVGIGCGSWILSAVGAHFSKQRGNRQARLGEGVAPGFSIQPGRTTETFNRTVLLLLWGLLPIYFWSEHVSYVLECLWGQQYYANVGILTKCLTNSLLLVGCGCVSIHQLVNKDLILTKFEVRSFRQSFGAGVPVGLTVWFRSFYYLYFESCIPGHDHLSDVQTFIYCGYTTLACAAISLMYSSVAVCMTFLWRRYNMVLSYQIRNVVDWSWNEIRRQILCFTRRDDRED